MHEESLVRSLLRQVDGMARSSGASRVRRIAVSVGELAGVEPELFRLAFERLSQSGVTSGATLELLVVPLRARCESCQREFRVHGFAFRCPNCGGERLDVVAGEELRLEEVDLDIGGAAAHAPDADSSVRAVD